MFNSKKNYVSPEVNVISVDKDIITVSGNVGSDENTDIIGGGNVNNSGGVPMPEVPGNWS